MTKDTPPHFEPGNWLTAQCPRCDSTNTTTTYKHETHIKCGDCGAEVWF